MLNVFDEIQAVIFFDEMEVITFCEELNLLAQGAFFLNLKFVFASLKPQFSNISRNLALPQFHETSLWQGFRELELSAKCLIS